MKAEEIYETIKGLSRSQGFYGRLLESIDENPEILDVLEQQNFEDALDMILFLEQ